MNLHGIVSGAIGVVNPFEDLTLYVSTGYVTADDGRRTALYATAQYPAGDVQALSAGEIQHLDFLNIQGIRRAIYLNGQVNGLVRNDNKGGDLVIRPDGTLWLVVVVLEQWPHWVKVAVVQQVTPKGYLPSLDFSNPANLQYLPGGL